MDRAKKGKKDAQKKVGIGKMAFFDGSSLKKAIFSQDRVGKIASRRG